MQSALDLAETIAQRRDARDIYRKKLSELHALRVKVNQVRSNVDAALSGTSAGIDSQTWLGVMTAYIRLGAKVRLGGFSAETPKELIYRINRSIKHSVWMVSQYAGLERAALGRATAARVPLSSDEIDRLAGYRVILEHNLATMEYQTARLLVMSGSANKQATTNVSQALAQALAGV